MGYVVRICYTLLVHIMDILFPNYVQITDSKCSINFEDIFSVKKISQVQLLLFLSFYFLKVSCEFVKTFLQRISGYILVLLQS